MRLPCSAFVLVVVLTVAASASICDRCTCRNSTADGTPIVVTCTCAADLQDLKFERNEIKAVNTVKKFEVKKCQSVTFIKNSFADAKKLSNLLVSQVQTVTFPMGVFNSLDGIFLEDISTLNLEKSAFLGVNKLNSISIKRTNITTLLGFSLYDVDNLNNLTMMNVNINLISSKAIKMKMAKTATVEIQNCEFSSVEKDGILIQSANKVGLTGSTIGDLDDNAISITAEEEVQVSDNNFTSNVADTAIALQSHSINVTNNTFTKVSVKLFGQLQATDEGLVRFSDNTVHDLDFNSLDQFMNGKLPELTGNGLTCSCNKTIAGPIPSLGQHVPAVSALLEHNFCIAPCRITLKEFPARRNRCESETDTSDVLCDPSDYESSSTTRPARVTTPSTTRRTVPPIQPQQNPRKPKHEHHTGVSTVPPASSAIRIVAKTPFAIVLFASLWLVN